MRQQQLRCNNTHMARAALGHRQAQQRAAPAAAVGRIAFDLPLIGSPADSLLHTLPHLPATLRCTLSTWSVRQRCGGRQGRQRRPAARRRPRRRRRSRQRPPSEAQVRHPLPLAPCLLAPVSRREARFCTLSPTLRSLPACSLPLCCSSLPPPPCFCSLTTRLLLPRFAVAPSR